MLNFEKRLYQKRKIILVASAVLVLYTLIGGLLIPLKSGLVGSTPTKIQTGRFDTLEFVWYNPDAQFKPEAIYLKKDNLFFRSERLSFKNEEFNAIAEFNIIIGAQSSGYADAYLRGYYGEANKPVWMYLSNAVWLEKGLNDSMSNHVSTDVIAGTEIIDNIQFGFPNRVVLNESIRNLLYHVPMWFSMIFLLFMASFYAVRYLRYGLLRDDLLSMSFTNVGIVIGILGCVTGAAWARVTWRSWWPVDDPKLNGVAIGMFMYFAYLILRNSMRDPYQRARISSVYNVLVFPIFMALIAIMPKLANNSLHPGTAGTVGFNEYDLDNTLRLFFYPAIIGWIGMFSFIALLRFRMSRLELKKLEAENDE